MGPGLRPLDYDTAAVNQVIQLFKHETGERYAETSVRHLPIPVWDGNLVLVDLDDQEPRAIHGVLYGTPFMDDIVRVAAFVVASEHQGQGWGDEAWKRFNDEAWKKGFRRVQTEVKAFQRGERNGSTSDVGCRLNRSQWLLSVGFGLHDARATDLALPLRTIIHRAGLYVMIEGLLRPLTDLSGVVSVHLVDRDGFVVYATGPTAGSDEIERWRTLVQSSANDATTTLVMENGYLILSTGFTTNLGREMRPAFQPRSGSSYHQRTPMACMMARKTTDESPMKD